MFYKMKRVVAALLVPIALSACSEVLDSQHEPGVYKGKVDPFLAKTGPELDKTLADRLLSVQKDR